MEEGDANAPKEVWLSRAAGGRVRERERVMFYSIGHLHSFTVFLPSIQRGVVQFGNIQGLIT